jgi:hypothetical protein
MATWAAARKRPAPKPGYAVGRRIYHARDIQPADKNTPVVPLARAAEMER